jgi:hypothetical protein
MKSPPEAIRWCDTAGEFEPVAPTLRARRPSPLPRSNEHRPTLAHKLAVRAQAAE